MGEIIPNIEPTKQKPQKDQKEHCCIQKDNVKDFTLQEQ